MKNTTKKTISKTIDASGQTLGRVASEAATFLMGKTKVTYERHIYSGLPVKIINASKLAITTKKLAEIYHTRYSGSRGGLKTMTGTYTAKTKGLKELIRLAIYRMLPGNKLRRVMMKNLTIEN